MSFLNIFQVSNVKKKIPPSLTLKIIKKFWALTGPSSGHLKNQVDKW
jgi:hypothetical protein